MEKGACASVFVLRDSPEYMGFLAPGCTFGVPRVRSFSEYRPGPVLLPESFCFPFGAAQGGLSRVDHPMLLFSLAWALPTLVGDILAQGVGEVKAIFVFCGFSDDFSKKRRFSMEISFYMAAKAAPLFCREAARIHRGEAAPLKTALPSADHSAPQAGPNLFLRPKAATLSSPRGRAPSPPFSFCRKKRTGRWSGPREKTPGAPRLNVLHEARKGPWIPPCWVRALPASRVGVSGVLFGFRRGRRHQTPDDFSLVPPGGTISFSKKEMVGPTVPRLEGGSLPSRARGAEYSALGSAFERSAALGRKEKLGPLCGKKVVRLSPRKKTAPQAEACGAVFHFSKKNCGKILYWGYLMAA